ncbi:MAG: hypothetical protein HWN65_05210 [Candidatus Helarchaeota archaeon]|nr:hypothetical protein [Candidatus Helarchaeota archaeon]
MIHNLYIINVGGIAIYTKNFAKSLMDEQLISGFILAVGNFAKEAVGSGLRKIEMETGEQLFVYHDLSTRLTAAAVTGSKDHPKLVSNVLPEILAFFAKYFGDKLDSPHLAREVPKFDPIVKSILEGKTAERNKKRFIFGLILGSLLLILLLILFIIPLALIAMNFQTGLEQLIAATIDYFDPEFLAGILSLTVGLFFMLELVLVAIFLPSSFVAGYTAGSRSRGKWIGVAFFFLTTVLSIVLGIFNVGALLLTVILIVFFPLALITSIAMGYLGGLRRDKRKLYPIDPEKKLDT